MRQGGCQCGAVRYEVAGEPTHHVLCHCADCRASAGAPAVAWIDFPSDGFRITRGEPKMYAGKNGAQRYFCPDCGTGLYYTNARALGGLVDIQTATLDNAAEERPQIQIQCAERLPWFDGLADLPRFERYPAG